MCQTLFLEQKHSKNETKSLLSGGRQYRIFSDYKMHRTIRPTQVLEEENTGGKKNPLHCCPPLPSKPGKLYSDYKTHPHFLPNLGGGECILQSEKYSIHIRGMVSGKVSLWCLLHPPTNCAHYKMFNGSLPSFFPYNFLVSFNNVYGFHYHHYS